MISLASATKLMAYRSTSLSVLRQWYWVPDKTLLYIPSQLIEYDAKNAKFKTIQDEVISIESSQLSGLNPANDHIHQLCNDLEELEELNEYIILHHLRKRYKQQIIYTNIGDVLISLNPYENVDIFTQNHMINYHKSSSIDAKKTVQTAHIYQLTQNCYDNLLKSKSNQSIIITGESAAGKTFNQHQVMSYLSTINNINGENISNININAMLIENNGLNILKVINILQCFGNATTLRNSNASRFGEWINVEFNNKTGQIIGCGFKHYLFETSRFSAFPKGEKSLHVLESIRGEIHDIQCRFLHPLSAHGNRLRSFDFSKLEIQFQELGFSQNNIQNIRHILLAILYTGSLTFESDHDHHTKDVNILNKIYKLLDIQADIQEFETMFNHSIVLITSTNVKIPNDAQKSLEMANIIAKFLYLSLFKYLFYSFSKLFERNSNIKEDDVSFINIFDFYGFQVFDNDQDQDVGNNFDQFMINWSAEKLEQIFVKHIFERENKIYSAELISTDRILANKRDLLNEDMNVLSLLECPTEGLLSLLHIHTKLWHNQQSQDSKLLNEMNEKLKNNKYYKKSEREKRFVIKHFGGEFEVDYSIQDFIKHNDNYYPTAMFRMFQESGNKILSKSTQLYVQSANFNRQTLNDQTNTKHFAKELNDLVHQVENTNPHFVRCIRPNKVKKPKVFDSKLVLKQIKYLGLLDIIKIRDSGLPTRLCKNEFVTRYVWLYGADGKQSIAKFLDKRQSQNKLSDQVLNKISQDLIDEFWKCQIGKNNTTQKYELQQGIKHVFMTTNVHSEFEKLRDKKLKNVFYRIEGTMHSKMIRKYYHKIRILYKSLKKAVNNLHYNMINKTLQSITEIKCSLDIKDVLLKHHLVKKAFKLLEMYNTDETDETAEFEFDEMDEKKVEEFKELTLYARPSYTLLTLFITKIKTNFS